MMIGLIIGFFFATIPIGICAIVKSAKVKDWPKAVLLPLSILSLVLYFVAIPFMHQTAVSALLILSSLALAISILSVSSHIYSKQTNKIYTDKTKEHQESVAKSEKKMEQEQSYIDEIKQLKQLLDSSAITQEDYDKKKSEILNRK